MDSDCMAKTFCRVMKEKGNLETLFKIFSSSLGHGCEHNRDQGDFICPGCIKSQLEEVGKFKSLLHFVRFCSFDSGPVYFVAPFTQTKELTEIKAENKGLISFLNKLVGENKFGSATQTPTKTRTDYEDCILDREIDMYVEKCALFQHLYLVHACRLARMSSNSILLLKSISEIASHVLGGDWCIFLEEPATDFYLLIYKKIDTLLN